MRNQPAGSPQLTFTVACLSVFLTGTPSSASSRQLRQVNEVCPPGCSEGACVADSTSGGLHCTKCLNNLLLKADTRACSCPPGKLANNNTMCVDCPKGSYCLGGQYGGPDSPGAMPCGEGFTTTGKRATSSSRCGEDNKLFEAARLTSQCNTRFVLRLCSKLGSH